MRRFLAPLVGVLLIAGCGGHSTRASVPTPGCPGYMTAYGCQAHSQSFGVPPAGTPRVGAAAPVPTVEMRDSVTVSAIPSGTPAVACYVVGTFANCGSMHAAFPHAALVSITPTASFTPARCLDDEPGDATPGESGGWVLADIRAGVAKPCEYASLSNMGAVKANLASTLGAGWRTRVFLWDADWTFGAHLDAGFDCTQWTDHGPQGQNYDESTCSRAFFGIAPKPKPPGPSSSTVTRWRGARNASFSAYHARRCTVGEADPKGTPNGCPVFAQRIIFFQQKLWTVERRWACWGKHARTKSYACWILRPETSYWSHARDASQRAFTRNVCGGVNGMTSLSPDCRLWRQRTGYFNGRVRAARKIGAGQ